MGDSAENDAKTYCGAAYAEAPEGECECPGCASLCCIHCLSNDGPHDPDDHQEPCEWCVIPPEVGQR